MHDHLIGLLERADLALASCTGVIEDDDLTDLIGSIRAVRTRLAYPDDILVVALAGGTGSGKSSLFNALNEEDLVDVGGIRPTTNRPAASSPPSGHVDAYLERLGIEERHRSDHDGLCLIDLPDHDSVETAHRDWVDELLPVVDVIVWVTDPEKYRDDRLHSGYLQPMARHSDQFLFVLNQTDRLTAADVDAIKEDLRRALEEDGIADPTIIPVAAAPPAGPPIGVEDVIEALDHKRVDRATLYGKLLSDLEEVSRELALRAGAPVDFDARAERVGTEASVALAAGDTVASAGALTAFLNELVAEVDGSPADQLRRLVIDVPRHISRVDASQAEAKRSRWWPWGRKPDPEERLRRCREGIDESVIRPARVILARRAMAISSINDLALHLQGLN